MVFLATILALAGILLGLVVPAAAGSTPPSTSSSDSNYDGRGNVAHTLASVGLGHDVGAPGRWRSGLIPEAALGRASGFADAAETVPEVAQAGDTVLFQKLSSTGEHLKYGITKNPATRHTAKEMDGGSLNRLARGSRQDMLALERSLHETLPIGPEEGQLFYVEKQIANGLRPPPYPW